MKKIQRVSFFFSIVFQCILIAMPIVLILDWIYAPHSIVIFKGMLKLNAIPPTYSNSILHTLGTGEKILGFVASLLPLCIKFFIVYWLIKLFKLFERAEIFSLQHVHYIRNIGYALLIDQLLVEPVYQSLMGIILTMNNPPGYRFFGITLNQTNIGILLMALLVILISWIMAEGYKLHEEQQLTI